MTEAMRSLVEVLSKSEPKDFVVCRICEKTFQQITTNGHLQKHDMTFEGYQKEFPEAPTMSGKMREKISAALTGKPRSEETKAKISTSSIGKIRSKESKVKQSATNIGHVHSKETKAKISVALTGRTGEKHHLHGGTLTEEHKAKIGAASIERWKDPEFRDRMTGESNSSWKDGRSFEPYCHAFNNGVRERIRNLCNRTCTICGRSTLQNISEKGYWLGRLAVDHLDENKMQGCDDWRWRLTALCPLCHLRMNKQDIPYHLLLQLLLLNNKRHQTNFLFSAE